MAALRTSARHDRRDWGEMPHSEGMLCVLSKQFKNKTSENLCACSVYLCVTNQLSKQWKLRLKKMAALRTSARHDRRIGEQCYIPKECSVSSKGNAIVKPLRISVLALCISGLLNN